MAKFSPSAPNGGGEDGPGAEGPGKISFKCSDLSYSILCAQDGIVPAPYLARAKWVQIQDPDALSLADLCAYIQDAHALVAAKLTRAQRAKLGL